jgi:cyclohexanecarboxylate-CoA ligase
MTGQSLWQLAERRAAASPDGPMLVDEAGERVSFGQFRDRAERVSGGLRLAGVTAARP